MTEEQMISYMNDVVAPRIGQLNDIIKVVIRYQKNKVSSELAMHEIIMLLAEENR